MLSFRLARPMRALAFALALLAGGAAQAIQTNYWTNATGDGKWSTAANWSLGSLPGTTDYVSLCSPVNSDILTIDVEGGVTVGALIVTNKPARVTGESLTLRGGVKGKVSSWGDPGYCGTEDVWSFRANAHLVMDCEVFFRPRCTCQVLVQDKGAYADVHFMKPVTYRPGTSSFNEFYLKVSGGSYNRLFFHSTVDSPVSVIVQDSGSSHIHFYGRVISPYLNMTSFSTSGNVHLHASDNDFTRIGIAYGGFAIPSGLNILPSNLVVTMPVGNVWVGAAVNTYNGLNLNNYDQTVNRLTRGDPAGASGTAIQRQGNVFSSDMDHLCNGTTVYRAPTTLTLRGTANGSALCAINDRVSLVWDPTGDYRQVFSNCTHNTSGDITVKRGTVSVCADGTFKNLHAIDVAAGAAFELDTSAAGSFAGLDRATVGAGGAFVISSRANDPFSGGYAVFELANGAKVRTDAAVTIPVVQYAGAFVADGTYTSGNAAWVAGSGSVTVSSSSVAVWTKVASGSWTETANWLGGRVPTPSMKKVVFPCAGNSYTVTLATETALPERVEIRNAGAGVATLKVAAAVTHAGGFLSLDPGGRLEVATGGRYDYTGAGTSHSASTSTPFRFVGGELLTSGGTVSISNATGGVAIGGKNGATGRIRQTSGTFVYQTTSSTHPIVLGLGGEISLSGDSHFGCVCTDGSTQYRLVPTYANEGGTLTVTDSAVFDISKSAVTYPTAHPRGKTVFSGSSYFDAKTGDYGQLYFNSVYTNRSEVIFRDHASMRGNFGNSYISGVLRYESDGASGSNGYLMAVGYVSGCKGELHMGGGSYGCMSCGLTVGGAKDNWQTSPLDTEGLFRMTGGAFRVNGDDTTGWGRNRPNGVLVGYGARTSVRCGRPFVGAMEIFGGAFTQNAGGLVVGAGYGKGDFVLAGGSYAYGGSRASVVGLCGGLGRAIVSNGTFTARYSDLYVGGAPYEAVKAPAPSYSPTSLADYVAAGYPEFRHDADGVLTIAGGTMTIAKTTYVGADGDGVLEVIGRGGAFSTGSLVLSNAVAGAGTATARETSSLVRFALDSDGVSTVTAKNLVIAEGAKLVVDTSAYTGPCGRKIKIFDAKTRTGSFLPENVTIERFQLIQDEDASIYIKAVWAQGLTIIFRQ